MSCVTSNLNHMILYIVGDSITTWTKLTRNIQISDDIFVSFISCDLKKKLPWGWTSSRDRLLISSNFCGKSWTRLLYSGKPMACHFTGFTMVYWYSGILFFCPDTESQNWACPRTAQKPGNMANIYSPKLEMLEPSIFIFEMYPSMWIVRYTIM